LCPEYFEEGPEDSLSQIVEKHRRNKKREEGDIPSDLADCVRDAADACPVQVILIEE